MFNKLIKKFFEILGYFVQKKEAHDKVVLALSLGNTLSLNKAIGIDAYVKWYEYLYDLLEEKIMNLKANLDEESKETVEKYIQMNISLTATNDAAKQMLIKQKEFIHAVTPNASYIHQDKHGVYNTNHGLDFLEDIKQKLKGKDVLDCGAFDGRTAIILLENYKCSIRKIHSFEPDDENFKLLERNTREHKKIIPVHAGVGRKTEVKKMKMTGGQGSRFENNNDGLDKGEMKVVKVHSIDDYVEENQVVPGFIKLDVEGLEYETVCSMRKTLEKFKPLLSISIYHNAKDFFEIKPLIESWELGYIFMIRGLNLYKENRWFTNEFMLIGEVSDDSS